MAYSLNSGSNERYTDEKRARGIEMRNTKFVISNVHANISHATTASHVNEGVVGIIWHESLNL